MKYKKNILIFFMTLLLMMTIATATTYYVSPTGNDTTGDGSEGNPWGTISCHFGYITCDGGGGDEFSTNDIVILKDGTYTEIDNVLKSIYIDTTHSGMTIKAENPGNVLVECPTCSKTFFVDTINVVFEDINITGYIKDVPRLGTATGQKNTYKNLVIQNSVYGFYLNNQRDTETVKHFHDIQNITFNNITTAFVYDSDVANVFVNNISLNGEHLYGPLVCIPGINTSNGVFYINNSFINVTGSLLRVRPALIESCVEAVGDITFFNNTFTGRKSVEPNLATYEATNSFDTTMGYSFYGDYDNSVYGNFSLYNNNTIFTEQTPALIEIIDATNLVLSDITVGTRDDKIHNENFSEYIVFDIKYYSENVTITNSSFNALDYSVIYSDRVYEIINFSFINNFVSLHSPLAGILFESSQNSRINNNIIYFDEYNNSLSYGFGFGLENGLAERHGNEIIGNTAEFVSDTPGNGHHAHASFMGATDNSVYENNYITGGNYGLVFKSSTNGLIKNNIFFGGSTEPYNLLLLKGGENITITHNTLIPTAGTTTAIGLTTSTNKPLYFAYAKNIVLIENNIINDLAVNNYRIYAGYINTDNSTFYLYNEVVENNSVFVDSDDGTVSVYVYNNITVVADDKIATTIKNSSGNTLYETDGSFEIQLLSYMHENYVTSAKATYDVYGEYLDEINTENVNLGRDYTVTFPLSDFPSIEQHSALGVKATTYVAFGLIALMIMVAAGMLFVNIMSGGANVGDLLILSIMGLGIAIVLFSGFLIISVVASSII